MDITRESRRSNMAASSVLLRRRHRKEDGVMELQETARVRGYRGSKRDLLNRTKRRRADRLVQGISREEGDESTEESVGGGDDYQIEEGELCRVLLPNATSSSSVLPNQGHRKSLPPPRVFARQLPSPKVAGEMIGVSVPRKTRSASVKRYHDSCILGNSAFGEDLNQRRASTSTPSGSAEAASPSSLNVSGKKKTKPNGPKNGLPKVSKSSSSVQEHIEIEIAEVLYGLMKQSQGSKEEKSENFMQKPDSGDANGIIHDSKPALTPVSAQASILPQNSTPASYLLPASKKQRVEVDSAPIQNSSFASSVKDENEQPKKMEVLSSKFEKGSGFNVVSELHEEAIEQGDSKSAIEEFGVASEEKSVSAKEETASCTRLDVGIQDSTVTKSKSNVSEVEGQLEKKFKIDLMAPPPMASSPERDGFIDLSSDPKPTSEDVEMKRESTAVNDEHMERLAKKEAVLVELEDEKIKSLREKPELKLDLEKPNRDDSNDNINKLQQKQHMKAIISEVEKTAPTSSMPLSIAVPGWPSGLPPLGYMPPIQTVVPMDGTAGSSTALQKNLQAPCFLLSQPRPKRCATHHYIASNIRLHQQFMKVNHFWPVAAGSAALCGTKPNNSNPMPSMEKMIIGNPIQGSFPVVNTNTNKDKGQVAANFPVFTQKDRSSEGANIIDPSHKKQLFLYQSQQPANGGLLHGPAFVFSLTQHQAAVAAAGSPSGAPKSVISVNKASLSGNAIAGVGTNFSALPAVAAPMSFSYPNLAASESPYLTVLPNNAYSFPISTPVGNPPAIRGGNPAQVLSFYSSQMLHPSQLQQQQSHSQVQPVHQKASSSSGSSSSYKPPQTQQPLGAQIGSCNFLASPSVQSHQQQQHHMLSHQPRKLETEMGGESALTIADTRASLAQKSVHGQNFIVPLQPSFTLVPSATVSGRGNSGEKHQQQQPQEKSWKGGAEIIPSQSFALSFASFNGGNTPSNLSFSSKAQNATILQSLPDMTCQGYHVVSTLQSKQKKNHQLSEGKSGGSATNPDDGKKLTLGKSPSMGQTQTLVFDNSARTLSFVSSPFIGNWPSGSITSTSNTALDANSSNSQQHQLLQLQKQHILHQQLQQQQLHPNGAAQSKTLTTNSLPSSCTGSKFSNNSSIFSQSLAQSNSPSQYPQWTNSPKTSTSQAPLTPFLVSNTSTLKNATHQHGRSPQCEISFGGNSKSNLAPQGHQMPQSNQSTSLLAVGSPPSSGNLRTTSTNAKATSVVHVLQSQQTDNSSTGNGQKSSPICGRNVPSILSTCPSHLSELKY